MDPLEREVCDTLSCLERLLEKLKPSADAGLHKKSWEAARCLVAALQADFPSRAADIMQSDSDTDGRVSGYPKSANMIDVYLQPISGAEPIELQVPSSSSFADLQAAVCTSLSCERSSFSLLMDGDPLTQAQDGELLSDHQIYSCVILTLVRKTLPRVLTLSLDRTAKIWDSSTGECKQTLTGHSDTLTSAAFSADASIIVTASFDNTAKIWDSSTGECQQTLTGHRAAFSADASRVVTASYDNTAKIWDSSTGECKQTLIGHSAQLGSAVFSTDASRVVTASFDNIAKIWDSSTGECKQTFTGHSERVISAVF